MQRELQVQINPQKVNGVNKSVYVFVALLIFAIITYSRMTSTMDATSFTSGVTINTYQHTAANALTLWSSDFHISPIADIKDILKDYGVKIIDKSLSGHCHLTDTCERDLRVITKLNGIHLRPCANALRTEFYNSYRNDPLMKSVDAFICTHAASMCELFMPFQKPMIVIASTR